jgi:predicted O-methyltransferase YrrM
MNQTIEKIYETGLVVGRSGEAHKLHSAIDREEGEFLFSLIRNDPKIRRTLEVGCAYGLSSLHICSATRERKEASHTIIDPFQNTQWDGAGVASLEAAGIEFFNLLEIKSEFALPQLLESNEGQLDFIFIDGWHTFDHTLLDCFYATRLLRIGGVLAIDDVSFPSVRRVVEFLKNYPCYEELGSVGDKKSQSWKRIVARGLAFPINRRIWAKILSPILYRKVFEDYSTRMIALRKTKEDSRNWDWHVDSF